MNSYAKGTQVRVSGAFTNTAGAAFDPTNVFFKQKDPEGTVTVYQYGVDAKPVKDSVGNYHADIDADEAGTWSWRFYSTGTGKAADEGSFTVTSSNFS